MDEFKQELEENNSSIYSDSNDLNDSDSALEEFGNLLDNDNHVPQSNQAQKLEEWEKIKKTIQNEEYSWEERQVYLKGIERALDAIYVKEKQYDSKTKQYKTVEKKYEFKLPPVEEYYSSQEKAMAWISTLEKEMTKKKKEGKLTNDNIQKIANSMAQHGSELMEREQLIAAGERLKDFYGKKVKDQALADIIKYIERGKKELDGETAIIASQQFQDRKKRIAENAQKLLDKASEEYPDHDWDEKTAKKVGAAIDIIKIVNPERGKELMDEMDVKKTDFGYEAIGPDGMFNRIDVFAESLLKSINDADPMLMRSSRQFKDLKASVEDLLSFERYTHEQYRDAQVGVDEFIGKLTNMRKYTQQMASKYLDYKTNALGGKTPNAIETKRINVSKLTDATADAIGETIRTYNLESTKDKTPEDMIAAVEKEVHTPDAPDRKQQLAEILYLQMIRKNWENKPELDVRGLLDYKTMKNQVENIIKDPAFEKAIDRIKDDLLGKNASDLMYGSYMQHKGKEYGLEKSRDQIKQDYNIKKQNEAEANHNEIKNPNQSKQQINQK